MPVLVKYQNRSVYTYAFLNQGSTRSFRDKSSIGLLGASRSTEKTALQTIAGAQSDQGQTISLYVSSLGNNEKYAFDILSIPNIPVAPNPLPTKRDLHLYTHLNDITFPRVPRGKASLLIGAAHPDMFCAHEVRRGASKEPIAIQTPLG